MNIFKKKKDDASNQISAADHDFKVAQLEDSQVDTDLDSLGEKEEKLINESTIATDPTTDDMPSANSKGREGGNKKKLQQVIIAVVGFVIVLIGLGTAMAKWQESKEMKRIEESEKAAQEQKKMATGRVDIADEQARIANENFQDLPVPAGAGLDNENLDEQNNQDIFVDPMPMSAGNASYQEPTYIEPINPMPKYANGAPSTAYMEPPPIQQESPSVTPSSSLSFFGNPDDNPSASSFSGQEEIIPLPKGADSNVLVDVNALRASKVTADDKSNSKSKVGGNLNATVLPSSNASRRSTKSLMLLRGTTIPCVLKTKIDSTYQGFTVCQISRDVYSADGKTLLLERGSQIFGEQNVDLNQGQARVAVLWTRVETPAGVSVNLESPATGQLGEIGIGAKVKTHFWKRFGGSIMLSIIQDAISVASSRLEDKQESGNNNTNINNTENAASSMAEEALKNTINIPPTATVNAGTVINIMVVRDVDFSDVYKLKRR